MPLRKKEPYYIPDVTLHLVALLMYISHATGIKSFKLSDTANLCINTIIHKLCRVYKSYFTIHVQICV